MRDPAAPLPAGRIMRDAGDVTRMLAEMRRGGRRNLDRLLPVAYAELRRLATRQLRGERSDHTLQPTDLVHEVYLKLGSLEHVDWQNGTHFFATCAQAMRRVLVDHAVRRQASKRGGKRERVPLNDEMLIAEAEADDVLALHDALSRLESVSERLARIVECRYFAGLSIDETARALELSPATVKRDWAMARAWLHRDLSR